VQLGDVGRVRSLDGLCSYVGLIRRMNSSADRMVMGKFTGRRRREIEVMLTEAAWVAVRTDPTILARLQALQTRWNRIKAIVRIAKNLLSRIRHVLNNQTAYERGVIK